MQNAKRNRRSRQKSLTKPSVSCRARQETLAQHELCHAQMLKSAMTYLSSRKTSQLNAGDQTVPVGLFLRFHLPFIVANSTNAVVFPRVNPPVSVAARGRNRQGTVASWMADAATCSRETLEVASIKEAQPPPLNTSLAFTANVQLCADFFLRTSCGSPNNDRRGLPPLSLLKYGNSIIQILEPLFSHS